METKNICSICHGVTYQYGISTMLDEENSIWLCRSCYSLVKKEDGKYSPQHLKSIKQHSEYLDSTKEVLHYKSSQIELGVVTQYIAKIRKISQKLQMKNRFKANKRFDQINSYYEMCEMYHLYLVHEIVKSIPILLRYVTDETMIINLLSLIKSFSSSNVLFSEFISLEEYNSLILEILRKLISAGYIFMTNNRKYGLYGIRILILSKQLLEKNRSYLFKEIPEKFYKMYDTTFKNILELPDEKIVDCAKKIMKYAVCEKKKIVEYEKIMVYS